MTQENPPVAHRLLEIGLHREHVQLIINVLGTRPHDEVRTLIDHIANTANAQLAQWQAEDEAAAAIAAAGQGVGSDAGSAA